MNDNGYSAKDIVVLSGTMGVRKRPAMYIGSTGSGGLIHLLYELIDNSVDEAVAGYCNNIVIELGSEDGMDFAKVSDNGRGIPVDKIGDSGKSALEVIMTSLHSGAKFDSKIYKVSGGLHGVGLTVINALSEYTEVEVRKDGSVYRQSFSRGVPVSALDMIGGSDETGTSIRFKPDREIFSARSFDTMVLKDHVRDLAFLNPGLRIELIDRRGDAEERQVFVSEKGIIELLDVLAGQSERVTRPIMIKKEIDSVAVSVAMIYVKSYSEKLISFVNNVKTPEGGTHVTGFHAAISRAILSYVQKNVKKPPSIEGDDTREGLVGIVSIMMHDPEFEGQTKEKLGSQSVRNIVDNAVYQSLTVYLEENPSEASGISGSVMRAAIAREAAKNARDVARKRNLFDGAVLPGKLSDCTESDPNKIEVFIVEGESAAGSSKQGRDRFTQAILPLKGKILNVEKASNDRIFGNAELRAMVTAFGTGIGDSFDISKLRYGRIILLTDADVDGSHIKTLLLTFFYRYMRPLIDHGRVYIAQPPLYKITYGKSVNYVYNDRDMEEIVKREPKSKIQRYKGLGEMNPEQLWETTMNPENRVLKHVTIKDVELADSLFTVLMGVDVQGRRKFLEEHSTDVSFLDI